MKINISGNRRVTDIQQEFNDLFPYLNLEFFDLAEDRLTTYISSGKRFPQFFVKDIRDNHTNGELEVNEHMTVMQLENLLCDQFGLRAQVFVRCADKWQRSSFKGYWSLYHKNESGKRATVYHRSEF